MRPSGVPRMSRTGTEVLDLIDDLNAHGKTIVLVGGERTQLELRFFYLCAERDADFLRLVDDVAYALECRLVESELLGHLVVKMGRLTSAQPIDEAVADRLGRAIRDRLADGSHHFRPAGVRKVGDTFD